MPAAKTQPESPSAALAPAIRDLPITLPSLQIAVVRVQVPMPDDDYEAFMNTLKAMKSALIAKPGKEKS